MQIKELQVFKVARLTLKSYNHNKMSFQCVALSYFITLSVIPFLAFLFAVSGDLGISDKISALLYKFIPTDERLVSMLIDKADNIIDIAQSGPVGIVSALIFFWSIIWMMFQVERVFNNVWGIGKIPRNIFKRFGFYISALLISPFIVMIFGAGIAFYSNIPKLFGLDVSNLKVLPQLIGFVVFYAVTVFTLSAMYKGIPAAKVRYRNALWAALIAGLVFVIFQYLYLETQMFVARMNAVYGVLAAVPLFLMWLNWSWQIILYGAQLSYSLQNVDTFNEEQTQP